MLGAENSTIVSLTDEEWRMAIEMGHRRNGEAEDHHRTQTDGSNSSNKLSNHIWGAGGEIAVAKYYEVRWEATINGFRMIPDLYGCEVRSTNSHDPEFRIKETDIPRKASWPFIYSIHFDNKQYEIVGWCYGWEGVRAAGKLKLNKHSKKPEWHVPRRILNAPFTFQSTMWKLRDLRSAG